MNASSLFLILFAVSAALAVKINVNDAAAAPSVPSLPQAFSSNFSVVFPTWVGPKSAHFQGYFAFDYKKGGAFLEIGGEEFVPLSFHTNFVSHPNANDTITGYMFEGPLCWKGEVSKSWLLIFPFQIPYGASYNGSKQIDGVRVDGWSFASNFYVSQGTVTIWVDLKKNAIVQVEVKGVSYIDRAEINFFNTQIGSPSPAIYAAPKMICTSPLLLADRVTSFLELVSVFF